MDANYLQESSWFTVKPCFPFKHSLGYYFFNTYAGNASMFILKSLSCFKIGYNSRTLSRMWVTGTLNWKVDKCWKSDFWKVKSSFLTYHTMHFFICQTGSMKTALSENGSTRKMLILLLTKLESFTNNYIRIGILVHCGHTRVNEILS